MNPVMSHLNLLVKVEARELLPPFCLLTQDLLPMLLERAKVVGSAIPPSTSAHSDQSGTRHLPGATHTSSLDPARLREIHERILQHNLECQDVQAHLNSKRQRLHRVAVKYGLSTSLWTAIFLMIPVLLLEASQRPGQPECGLPSRSQQVPPVLHRGRKGHRRHLHDLDLHEEGRDIRADSAPRTPTGLSGTPSTGC
jgi:hypothetical protein